MRRKFFSFFRLALLLTACAGLASCDDPQVYGSVGFSNYHGGHYGGGMRTSIGIGGRIY